MARELVVLVRNAGIRDAGLRDQALRAAKSACLNIAEACGRHSRADKARVYAIARGEACEAAAALDVAFAAGECSAEAARTGAVTTQRLYALLTALLRS